MSAPNRRPFPVAARWADGTPVRDAYGNAPDPTALKAASGQGWAKRDTVGELRMQLAALVGAVDALRWVYESGQEPSENMREILYREAEASRALYTLKDVNR